MFLNSGSLKGPPTERGKNRHVFAVPAVGFVGSRLKSVWAAGRRGTPMPEESLNASSAEEIKKQRVAKLEEEIGKQKQHLARMVKDKNEWKQYSFQVSTLQEELGGNKLEQGTEAKKQRELAACRKELERIGGKCCKEYHVQTILALGSAIDNYEREIGNQEAKLQRLEGVQYEFRQQGSQSQQGQEDHIRQRVNGVAEHQAEFMKELKKHYEPVQLPEWQEQNQNTVLRVTNFQDLRERIKQAFNSKVQEQLQQDRSRKGHEK